MKSASVQLHQTVVLIGAMAVGKTAIGSELAQMLNVRFIDTDAVVTDKHGPIPDIFANHSEFYFRALEAKAVSDSLDSMRRAPGIISLGGGAVLDSGTQQLLRTVTVVYLEADAATVRDRIAKTSHRPMLASRDGENQLQRWEHLSAVRKPIYERLANITVDVRTGTPAATAQKLSELLAAKDELSSLGLHTEATKEKE